MRWACVDKVQVTPLLDGAPLATVSTHVGVPRGPERIVAPGRQLLVMVLNNPHCHYWFAGMAKYARKAGLGVVTSVADEWDPWHPASLLRCNQRIAIPRFHYPVAAALTPGDNANCKRPK